MADQLDDPARIAQLMKYSLLWCYLVSGLNVVQFGS